MADCCTSAANPAETLIVACPGCHTRGISVEVRTVKAMLTESALGRVECLSHRFCRTPDCPVVYYDETGRSFARHEVRARIWQKEPAGDRAVCYCFAETEATIRDEFVRTGRSDAVQRVKEHIAANRCACDIRNPRGTCCLGDLSAAVTRVSSELLTKREVS
jgi:hypothetical protein